ncbi:MAG: hypothetical protein GY913_03735 [Proteobacteria bacterium]|nr:hypothetical protein [Pseudomonadota bacterium]MCP4916013.1 hypothetical protein [Pseudomonadota bacterium]
MPRRIAIWALELTLVSLLYLAAVGAMTWPALAHPDEVIIGGGELGGWLWRYWWHFTEVDALLAGQFGLIDSVYTFLSLGRHPETGNILDVLFISWPLAKFFSIPLHYNLKIFLILVGDGVLAYMLARSLTPYRLVAACAGLTAVINPVSLQDLYGSGLRQLVLWFLLLFPLLLDRAERRERMMPAIGAGLMLGLVGAFYWFYGLFAAMFFGIWFIDLIIRERRRMQFRRVVRWMGPMFATMILVAGFFALPYIIGETGGGGLGSQQKLPELSFFLSFPEYDVIRDVPLRPDTYTENVLSSLNRTIQSSYSPDNLFNPGHARALPMVVFFGGVLPALLLKPGQFPRSRFWLVVFLVFWVGTLGPYLKWAGFGNAWGEVVLIPLGDGFYTLRMPWTWMFKWVPGMSRMFAPYRMGSMVAVASVALVAMGLSRITNPWVRNGVSLAAIVATFAQMNFLWHVDAVDEGDIAPIRWLAPIPVSSIETPTFYTELDSSQRAGIIELPLEQQQDLINYYQLEHGWKVFRSWASHPAIPPVMRDEGGGEPGDRLRYLAQSDLDRGPAADLLRELSNSPQEADVEGLDLVDFDKLVVAGNYRYLIVHERGYYLVDPQQGPLLYNDMVRRLSQTLGIRPVESIEINWVDYPGNRFDKAWGPARVPWSSYAVNLPDKEMPNRFFMSVFDLSDVHERWEGPEGAELLESELGGPGGSGPAHQEREHIEVAPGAGE